MMTEALTIILDTSVLSLFFRKAGPARSVQAWYESVLGERLVMSAITRFEMVYGLSRLPKGSELLEVFDSFLQAGGIEEASVTGGIARHAALQKRQMETRGKTYLMADLLIGATASSFKAQRTIIATVNVTDFDCWGIETLNPEKPGRVP